MKFAWTTKYGGRKRDLTDSNCNSRNVERRIWCCLEGRGVWKQEEPDHLWSARIGEGSFKLGFMSMGVVHIRSYVGKVNERSRGLKDGNHHLCNVSLWGCQDCNESARMVPNDFDMVDWWKWQWDECSTRLGACGDYSGDEITRMARLLNPRERRVMESRFVATG